MPAYDPVRDEFRESSAAASVISISSSSTDLNAAFKTPTSAKRKAEESGIDSDDERFQQVTETPDQVRRRVRSFLATGEMKIRDFQRVIGVSSHAYSVFMETNGPATGSGGNTYENAFAFFQKRELRGIKLLAKKVKRSEASVLAQSPVAKTDVPDIHLDGEDELAVPVYDSCDEVRRKIRAHLLTSVTQAAFLRDIGRSYPEARKIQSKSLNDFLNKRGPTAGNTNAVYYAAYVFFEKLRIRDGKPLSKHRREMEATNQGGLDTKRRRDHVWVTTC